MEITIFKNGKPFISMSHLYHGYMLNNQGVISKKQLRISYSRGHSRVNSQGLASSQTQQQATLERWRLTEARNQWFKHP